MKTGMDHASNYPDLQIEEDLRQQKREWRVQRVVWVFLYALLIAVIFGLLGGGPLRQTRLYGADNSFVTE